MERSKRWLAGCTGCGWTDAEFCRAIEGKGKVSFQTRIDRPWEKVHYIKSEFDWIQFGALFLSLMGPGARPCRLAWMNDEKMKAQSIDFFWRFCWWKKGRRLEWNNQNKWGAECGHNSFPLKVSTGVQQPPKVKGIGCPWGWRAVWKYFMKESNQHQAVLGYLM